MRDTNYVLFSRFAQHWRFPPPSFFAENVIFPGRLKGGPVTEVQYFYSLKGKFFWLATRTQTLPFLPKAALFEPPPPQKVREVLSERVLSLCPRMRKPPFSFFFRGVRISCVCLNPPLGLYLLTNPLWDELRNLSCG